MSHRSDRDTVPVPEITIPIRAATIVLGSIGAALLVVHVITRVIHWSGMYVPMPIALLLDRFDVDGETSVPTWFSILLLLAIAVLAFVIARVDRPAGSRAYRWWYAVAAVALYLSIDEGAALHEIAFQPMQRLLGVTSGPLLFAWVVPGAIAVIVVAAVFVRFFLTLPKPTKISLAIAAGVYVLGALGMEMLTGALIYDIALPNTGGSLTVDLFTAVEEGLELAGAILAIRALLQYLTRFALPQRAMLVRVD